MKTTILLIAALAVSGCGKKTDGAGGGSAGADDKACTAAIGKAVDTMIEGRRKMVVDQRAAAGLPPQDPDMTQMTALSTKLRTTLVTRCTEDKWPATVVTCFDRRIGLRLDQEVRGRPDARAEPEAPAGGDEGDDGRPDAAGWADLRTDRWLPASSHPRPARRSRRPAARVALLRGQAPRRKPWG